MWCVCAQLYMDQSKNIFDHFICFWKWFLSFFVSMFSAYFVSHCLSMFCVEKQVLEFLTTHSGDLQAARPSHEVTQNVLVTHSWLVSHETPRISFLKSFFMETYFKHLLSSLKPLFQYFYIKTQSIWMVFSFH